MSNISANIVVESNPINVVVEPFGIIGVTVEPTTTRIFTGGGVAVPGGNSGELQFNGGIFLGVPNVTWDGTNLNLGDVSNVKVFGGSNGFALITDGAGTLNWTNIDNVANANFANFAGNAFSVNGANVVGTVANSTTATFAGTVTTNAQPNITSVGTLTSLTVNGESNLGNVDNVAIFGGNNGFFLQTDGTGNLSWTAADPGGGGNGTPGGTNTQVQFNDAGVFAGNVGFTFDKTTGDLSVPGVISGGGAGLSNIQGANVVGEVANANFATTATTAATVTTNAQPNITSVGTLSSLAVAGNAIAGNVYANSGTVGASLLTGTLTTNAQPNITSVGNLTQVVVEGTTQIQQAIEKVTISNTAASGTINFDVLTQAIVLNTANATANFALNYRGNSTTTLNSILPVGSSLTATFINTNGFNGFYANSIRIDDAIISPIWTGDEPIVGTPNGKDVYTFNIIKTANNTYTVLGSQLGFK